MVIDKFVRRRFALRKIYLRVPNDMIPTEILNIHVCLMNSGVSLMADKAEEDHQGF